MNKQPVNKEKLGELFFGLNKAIKEKELERRKLMIENIDTLANIFDKKLYKVEFEDWAGFLGQIEVFYSRTEVNRFLIIKKRLIDEFNFDPYTFLDIPVVRLENITKFAKNKAHASELIDKAKTLTSQDWRNEINVLKGKPAMEDCKHDFQGYEICKICGLKRKI